MGQRNGPRTIPSLLEYKTIRLRDRYSTLNIDSDRLDRANEASEKGQKGGLTLDANGKPASASTPQLPPSLASYGGLHSFSQMAQFLPTICNQNIKRRPPPLLPLSLPGLSSGQTSQEATTFYRSSMPEAFISASSNLINSSSTVPFTNTGNLFHNQQIGALSSPGLECIGKSGLELPKPSEPACIKLKIEKLPPIGRSHCTVHSTKCSCVHTKNSPHDRSSSEDKTSVKRDRTDVKREPHTVVGRRKLKASEPNGNEPKGSKPIRKAEKKSGLKTKQRHKRETPVEAKKSISSEQKQQLSQQGHQETDSYDDEEEGISSYVRRNRIHTRPSPRSNTSNNDDEVHCDDDECSEEENDLDYYHRNTSILHPPPGSLPPITNPKAHLQGTSLLEDLGERASDDNMGWAKDGFLEDSALRRAILLRTRALYNTSSNNTAAVTPNNIVAVCNTVPCEDNQVKTKDEVIEEVKEIRKPLEVCAEKLNDDTQGESVRKCACKDSVERKLGRAHHIRSVTWQDVSPHLGPKKTKLTRLGTVPNQRSGKLNPIVEQASKLSIAAQALRRLKKNRTQKHRDHTNCISTVPKAYPADQSSAQLCIQNLPPVQLFGSQDLAISCGARTSKSLGTMSGKGTTDMPGVLRDTAMLFTSSYPKFIKMFSLPTAYKTRFPASEQTGKEKNFEGHIDGTKVKQRNQLETGPDECQKEKSGDSLTNVKPK